MARALESIQKQTYEDFEVIISDNASTDRTAEVCREFAENDERIRYVRNEENKGAAYNYNRVFELSRGQYFKWMAHDDLILPTYLAKCVQILTLEARVVLCFPQIAYIDEHDKPFYEQDGDLSVMDEKAGERTRTLIHYELSNDDIYWAVFGLGRREAFAATPLIANYNASDQVLLYQIALQGQFYQINQKLYLRREHSDASMTRHKSEAERQEWFDPNVRKKFFFTHWHLWYQHHRSVQQFVTSFIDRIVCHTHILRRFIHEWRTLGGEVKLFLKLYLKQRRA